MPGGPPPHPVLVLPQAPGTGHRSRSLVKELNPIFFSCLERMLVAVACVGPWEMSLCPHIPEHPAMPLGAEIGPGQCQPMGAALGGAEWGGLAVQEQRTPTAGTAPLAGCKQGVPWGWGLCRDRAQGPAPSSSCGWRGAPILAPPPRALSPAKLGPSGGQGSGGPAPHPCIVSLHPRAPLLDSPPGRVLRAGGWV